MKKLLLILGLSLGLTTSALGNSFNGYFVCEIIYVSDGSKEKISMVIDGNFMKSKRFGEDDKWYTKNKLIYRGQYNLFVTFVTQENAIIEDITTVTKIKDGGFHYNRIGTHRDDKYSGLKQAQARHKVGLCTKFL